MGNNSKFEGPKFCGSLLFPILLLFIKSVLLSKLPTFDKNIENIKGLDDFFLDFNEFQNVKAVIGEQQLFKAGEELYRLEIVNRPRLSGGISKGKFFKWNDSATHWTKTGPVMHFSGRVRGIRIFETHGQQSGGDIFLVIICSQERVGGNSSFEVYKWNTSSKTFEDFCSFKKESSNLWLNYTNFDEFFEFDELNTNNFQLMPHSPVYSHLPFEQNKELLYRHTVIVSAVIAQIARPLFIQLLDQKCSATTKYAGELKSYDTAVFIEADSSKEDQCHKKTNDKFLFVTTNLNKTHSGVYRPHEVFFWHPNGGQMFENETLDYYTPEIWQKPALASIVYQNAPWVCLIHTDPNSENYYYVILKVDFNGDIFTEIDKIEANAKESSACEFFVVREELYVAFSSDRINNKKMRLNIYKFEPENHNLHFSKFTTMAGINAKKIRQIDFFSLSDNSDEYYISVNYYSDDDKIGLIIFRGTNGCE